MIRLAWPRPASWPLGCLLLLCACRDGAAPGGAAPGGFVAGMLALSREAVRQGVAPGPVAGAAVERALARLEARVQRRVRTGQHPVDALNQVVFEREGYRRDVEDSSLRRTLLPLVLQSRRGSCTGLAGLYLALGQRLNLPLGAVLVPGHMFVRYRGPRGSRGVELLKRGREMPRSWYVERYRPPPRNRLYLQRTLPPRQALAIFRFNLAGALRQAGQLRAALVHYRRVVRQLPQFAEAQANLGLVLQRLGQLDGARAAYQRARRANPALEGLERNLRALQRAGRGAQVPTSPGRP